MSVTALNITIYFEVTCRPGSGDLPSSSTEREAFLDSQLVVEFQAILGGESSVAFRKPRLFVNSRVVFVAGIL